MAVSRNPFVRAKDAKANFSVQMLNLQTVKHFWSAACLPLRTPVQCYNALCWFCKQSSTFGIRRSESLAPVAKVTNCSSAFCEQYSALEMHRSESLAPVAFAKKWNSKKTKNSCVFLAILSEVRDAMLGIHCPCHTHGILSFHVLRAVQHFRDASLGNPCARRTWEK